MSTGEGGTGGHSGGRPGAWRMGLWAGSLHGHGAGGVGGLMGGLWAEGESEAGSESTLRPSSPAHRPSVIFMDCKSDHDTPGLKQNPMTRLPPPTPPHSLCLHLALGVAGTPGHLLPSKPAVPRTCLANSPLGSKPKPDATSSQGPSPNAPPPVESVTQPGNSKPPLLPSSCSPRRTSLHFLPHQTVGSLRAETQLIQ